MELWAKQWMAAGDDVWFNIYMPSPSASHSFWIVLEPLSTHHKHNHHLHRQQRHIHFEWCTPTTHISRQRLNMYCIIKDKGLPAAGGGWVAEGGGEGMGWTLNAAVLVWSVHICSLIIACFWIRSNEHLYVGGVELWRCWWSRERAVSCVVLI